MINTKTDYLSLASFAIIYILAVFHYQTVPQYLMFATICFAGIYVLWGIFHHLHAHNFHLRIVLEYLAVAGLGVALVSTLLL